MSDSSVSGSVEDTHWGTLAALFAAAAVITWFTVTLHARWTERARQPATEAAPPAAQVSSPPTLAAIPAPTASQPAAPAAEAPPNLPPAVETVEQHQRQTDKIARGLEPNPGGGVRVTAVAPNSIASQLRVEPGDVIVSMNGHPVSTPEDFARIYREQGLPSQMTVLHQGREMHHH